MREHESDIQALIDEAADLEDQARLDDALAGWDRAREASAADDGALGECENGRARVLTAMGRLDDADAADREAKAHFETAGQQPEALLCDAILAWRAAATGATEATGPAPAARSADQDDEGLNAVMAARDVLVSMTDEPAAVSVAARACQMVGQLLFAAGRPEEGEQQYLAARDRFADAGDDRRLARCDAALAVDLLGAGRLEDAEGRAEAAIAGLTMLDRDVHAAQVQLIVGRIQAEGERYEEAQANFGAARTVFAAHELDGAAAEAGHLGALVASSTGDDEAAVALLTTAVEAAERAGMPAGVAASRLERGAALDRLGQFPAAEVDLGAAAGTLNDLGDVAGSARAIYGLAVVRRSQGDREGAAEAFAVAASTFDDAGFPGAAAQARLDGAPVLEELGRIDEALAWLQAAADGFAAEGEPVAEAVARRSWGAVAGFAGRPEGLVAVVDARAAFVVHGAAWDVAESDDVIARLLRSAGRPAEAAAAATTAMQGFSALGDAVAEASAGMLLGRLLAESGRMEEAVERLEESVRTAAGVGIGPLTAAGHDALADVFDALGRVEDAVAHREAAARLA